MIEDLREILNKLQNSEAPINLILERISHSFSKASLISRVLKALSLKSIFTAYSLFANGNPRRLHL